MKNAFASISHRSMTLPRRKFLLYIFLCSLGVRLLFIFWNPIQDHNDLYEHGDVAHNIIMGHGFTMHWPYPTLDTARFHLTKWAPDHEGAFLPPVNPYLLASFFVVFGENETATTIYGLFLCLLGSFVPIVTYHLTKYFASESVARLAAILASFNVFAAFAVSTYTGSTLYHLLALLCIYSLFRAHEKKSIFSYVIVGVLLAVMTLLRSEFFLLGPLLVVLSAWLFEKRPSVRITYVAVALFVQVLFISPWIYRNYQIFDKFVPVLSHPWFEIWRGNNPVANGTGIGDYGRSIWIDTLYHRNIVAMMDSLPYNQHFEIAVDSIFKEQVITFWQNDPLHALSLGCKKVLYFVTSDFNKTLVVNIVYTLVSFILFGTMIVGLVHHYRKKVTEYSRFASVLFMMFLVYYIALTFLTVMQPRYQIYVFNTLIPMSAAGLTIIVEAVRSRIKRGDTRPEAIIVGDV